MITIEQIWEAEEAIEKTVNPVEILSLQEVVKTLKQQYSDQNWEQNLKDNPGYPYSREFWHQWDEHQLPEYKHTHSAVMVMIDMSEGGGITNMDGTPWNPTGNNQVNTDNNGMDKDK